jgi:hypothetical protein
MRLAILNALLLAGCASTQPVMPEPLPINSIVYTAGPLDTVHPVYVVMLNDIVPSFFRGEKNTAFVGTKAIGRTGQDAVTMKHVSDLLAPWTGANSVVYAPGLPNCPAATANMPTVAVGWAGGGGSEYKSLSFDFGCAAANPALAAALRSIPATLGIEPLIGPAGRR